MDRDVREAGDPDAAVPPPGALPAAAEGSTCAALPLRRCLLRRCLSSPAARALRAPRRRSSWHPSRSPRRAGRALPSSTPRPSCLRPSFPGLRSRSRSGRNPSGRSVPDSCTAHPAPPNKLSPLPLGTGGGWTWDTRGRFRPAHRELITVPPNVHRAGTAGRFRRPPRGLQEWGHAFQRRSSTQHRTPGETRDGSPTPCGRRRRRHRGPGRGRLPQRGRRRRPGDRNRRPPGQGDPAGGVRPARRQAADRRDRRAHGRPRRRVDAGPPARGGGAGPRGRASPTRLEPPATAERDHLDPRRAAADARGPGDGRPRRPAAARRLGRAVPRGPGARTAQDPDCRRTEVGEDIAIGAYVAARRRPRGRRPAGGTAARRRLRGRRLPHLPARPPCRSCCPRPATAARSSRAVQALQRAGRPPPGRTRGPSSMGISGGIGRLPVAVADAVRVPRGRTSSPARPCRELRRTEAGWLLTVAGPEGERADRPPTPSCSPCPPGRRPAARTPRPRPRPPNSPRVEYAGMALVTMAFRRADMPATAGRQRLPGAAGRRPHHQGVHLLQPQVGLARRRRAPDVFVLRTSVGRSRRGGRAWSCADERTGGRLAGRPRARRSGCAPCPSRPGSPAGTAACRSTPSATSDRVARIRARGRPSCRALARVRGRVRRRRHPGLHRERPARAAAESAAIADPRPTPTR